MAGGWSWTIKRRLIQWIAFGMTNAQMGNLATGKLYRGPWKQFCSPGLNCYSCPAAVTACPIGAMQAVAGSLEFGFSFYVAGILVLTGGLLGRAACGFLCPFGLLQDLLYKLPTPKRKLPWRPLIYLKYFLLAAFVLLLPAVATDYMGMGAPAYCEYICPAGTLEGGIPLLLLHPELRQAAGALLAWKLGILLLTLLGCMTIARFFCKVLCPLGAVYGLMNRFSVCHLRVERERCISCGRCQRACPMEIHPVVSPDSPECIRCGNCAAQCPRQAIRLAFSASPPCPSSELPHH